MPEHPYETDDLDVLFRELVDDVEVHSRRPGAARAVRSGRTRRAVAAAGVVAAVLAVVVALGGWWSVERAGVPVAGPPTVSAVPSAPPTDQDVPAPARLGLDALREASRGWASWGSSGPSTVSLTPCVRTGAGLPLPPASSGTSFTGPSVEASLERVQLGSVDASNVALRAALDRVEACAAARETYSTGYRVDLEVTAFGWRSGGRSGTTWIMNHADRIDVLTVVGAPAASDEVYQRFSRLLAADIQVP